MGSIVSLVSAENSIEDLKSPISEALRLAEFKFKDSVKTVVIKPNLCYYWDSSTGNTTDPRVVAAVVDLVREKYGDIEIKVAEADASAMRTKHAFPVLGYEKMAKEKNVELFNLSNDVLEEKTLSIQGHEISLKVPQLLMTSDLFINVPKLKVMRATKITCGMKNLFGAIGAPRKLVYHPVLNETIVGICKFLRPHLTIVDGLISLGAYPKKLNLFMASSDVFSIDWVAAQIMGFNPSDVKFLRIAMKEGVGNKNGIVVKGEEIDKYRQIFPRPKRTTSNRFWALEIGLLKFYTKVTGDIVPPMLEEG